MLKVRRVLQLPELPCEYQIDEERILKEVIEGGKVTAACTSKYLVQDDWLYYLSNKDEIKRENFDELRYKAYHNVSLSPTK